MIFPDIRICCTMANYSSAHIPGWMKGRLVFSADFAVCRNYCLPWGCHLPDYYCYSIVSKMAIQHEYMHGKRPSLAFHPYLHPYHITFIYVFRRCIVHMSEISFDWMPTCCFMPYLDRPVMKIYWFWGPVDGLVQDSDHTSSCLSHYSSLEFVASDILNSLQCTW